MISSSAQIRVRFAETDAMGIAYHGNYFAWFEVARIAMLDSLGLSYSALHKSGMHLPVLEVGAKYIRSAFFDDTLEIRAEIREKPLLKIRVDYEVRRGDELLCAGHSVHAFVNSKGVPIRPPAEFMEKIKSKFAEDK
ncbi:MAG: acyl-CoA thioesterase [Opitutales bacterium]|nr:acyl-CoA thioesterase [Opitutales bacterium]